MSVRAKLPVIVIFVLTILSAGCILEQEAAEPAALATLAPTIVAPTPTLAPAQPTATELAPVVVDTIDPTAVPTVLPTLAPTVTPPPAMPTATPMEVRQDLYPGMPTSPLLMHILSRREAGATIDQVAAELAEAGLLFPAADNPLLAAGASAYGSVDAQGNGVPFWLFGLNRGPSPDQTLYELWFVSDSHLELAFIGSEYAEAPPLLLAAADFSGDGRPDFLLQQMSCGAHTCWGTYNALTYHTGRLTTAFDKDSSLAQAISVADKRVDFSFGPAGTLNMSLPTITLEDLTGDGVVDIKMRGGMASSAGAGIHQGFNQLWSWSGDRLELTDFAWDYTGYRHHELYDGNFAYAMGEREIAMTHYIRVIFDDSLNDSFVIMGDVDHTLAAARQIAAFRLLLTTEADPADWLDYLQTTYPGTPLTEAARRYLAAVQGGATPAAACAQVTDYLTAQSDPLGAMAGQLGYGNPDIAVDEICKLPLPRSLEATLPHLYTEPVATGNPTIDGIIAAVLAHDSDAFASYLHPIERPCSDDPAGFGGPACEEGMAAGTPVLSLLAARCEGYYLNVDPNVPPDFSNELSESRGLYGVITLPETNGHILIFGGDHLVADMFFVLDEQGITDLIWVGCMPVASRFLQYVGGDVLIAPPEPSGRTIRGY